MDNTSKYIFMGYSEDFVIMNVKEAEQSDCKDIYDAVYPFMKKWTDDE